MPSPKKECTSCGGLMHPTASQCRKCKPTYERTPEHRRLMSRRTRGIPKDYPTGGSDPAVAKKIAAAWTPQMREKARRRGLQMARDPEWRERCGSPGESNPMWENGRSQIPYAPGWARKVKEIARDQAGRRCEMCDRGDTLLDTHHKDFRKDNHALSNLQVLCRKCHKGLHAERARRSKNRRG